jgi:hypothetical protein
MPVHVVHLVRDPRGVAHSWQRTFARADVMEKVEMVPTRRPSRVATEWLWRNALAQGLRRRSASYRRVRYEDFVASPQAVADGVWSDCGLVGQLLDLDEGRRVAVPASHTIWGNPRRQVGPGTVVLRLDDEWRGRMRPADRRTVTLLTMPLLRYYGY